MILEKAFSKNKKPSIFIISPYKTVVKGLRKYITEYCKHNDTKIDSDFILDLSNKKIGTVHTFQGKEADEVIFVLGCDKSSIKSTKFVRKSIVNVAVTRGKYRLYVVGDLEVWKQNPIVNKMYQIIKECEKSE